MSWVKLHRKFLHWEWYDDINTKTIFLHLLLTANYEDKKWRGFVIRRGQRIVGSLALANEVRLSRQKVRTALERLKSTNEITTKSTNEYTIITIVKYEEYQSAEAEVTSEITNEQPAPNQRTTNEQPTDNQRITTTKEIKEIKESKEEESILVHFENFWNRYGKIGNKQSALRSFKKIKGVNYAEIITGLERYQAQCRALGTERQFIKHASSWLNNRGWEDEYPIYSPKAKQPTADDSVTAGINLALRELAQG